MNNEHVGPLKGLKVIELAALGPVPFCGMMLADMGAEVIRVDRIGAPLGLPMDKRFDLLGRGRESIALDLKQPECQSIVLDLCESADVLMEGMRPGAAERLGLGPDQCHKKNPGLIYARMTGWGQTGPMAQAAGHDINYLALNGVLHATGAADGPPIPPINLVGDYGGGAMFLIAGILAALWETNRTGKGQVVDAAMLEGSSYLFSTIQMFMAAGMWSTARGTNLLDGGAPFYGTYETADGEHMAVGAIEPKFYAALLDGLDLQAEDLPGPYEQSRWPKLRQAIADAFARKTREQWTEIFDTLDACVTPVLSAKEALSHAQNQARSNFTPVGEGFQPSVAPRFSRTPAQTQTAIPESGAHSRRILAELGFDSDRIDALLSRGLVGEPE